MICRWFCFRLHQAAARGPTSPFRVMGPAELACDPIGVDGLDFGVSVSKGYTEYAEYRNCIYQL